ncbi:aldehyde dehydrogenase family protein [Serratia ureilytica]
MLHVVRFQRNNLDALVDQINAAGYGLTLGIHTRIDETIARVTERAKVGNLYVNRNMVGAVVGVQPFGGEGLSGTGPKAGGPLYPYRLLANRPDDALQRTLHRQDEERPMEATARPQLLGALQSLEKWAVTSQQGELAALAQRYAELGQVAPYARCRARPASAIPMPCCRVNACCAGG